MEYVAPTNTGRCGPPGVRPTSKPLLITKLGLIVYLSAHKEDLKPGLTLLYLRLTVELPPELEPSPDPVDGLVLALTRTSSWRLPFHTNQKRCDVEIDSEAPDAFTHTEN